ncbi:Folylpolyglutamate synthase, mitochondrial [Holothuria leucospilota]|uniref:Folylpolyglutamate synthase n=1 Tax=Holothuria leucospilota TaxID=206669 RepID=A0A9Q1C4M4_HOLLE|nr:Folylpolyglutamate synthase, mitochondrial [Holothuria leucospilota]
MADLINKQSYTREVPPQMKSEVASSSDVSTKAYQESIIKLNSLQSTPEELKLKKHNANLPAKSHGVKLMTEYLNRCGLNMEKIHQIPVIHVAGTKGKGSVCAFTESIIRKYGKTTGLYTSPHLIEVRERIRINGKPLDYDKFANYFFEIFTRLTDTKKDFGEDLPNYPRMLLVLGFYTFWKEKARSVDVAVIEVGMGGEYDSTNFIGKPIVTGISSLGMDHLKSLGDTIAQIAWHKAGIFKPGRPAFTVPQPLDAMKEILERAKEIGTEVQCVTVSDKQDFGKQHLELGIGGKCQTSNATLSIHLCREFLEKRSISESIFREISPDVHPPQCKLKSRVGERKSDLSNGSGLGMTSAKPFVLPEEFKAGLRDCYWPGRCQQVERDKVTYYVDGAHTQRSIENCVEWFLDASGKEEALKSGRTVKMLVFNLKANKYKPSLIKPLLSCKFVGAAFCPNYIEDKKENPGDQTCCFTERGTEQDKSRDLMQKFEDLKTTSKDASSEEGSYKSSPKDVEEQVLTRPVKCVNLPSIQSALQWASAGKDEKMGSPDIQNFPLPETANKADRIQVLVTGSLYLVGGALTLLDRQLASK